MSFTLAQFLEDLSKRNFPDDIKQQLKKLLSHQVRCINELKKKIHASGFYKTKAPNFFGVKDGIIYLEEAQVLALLQNYVESKQSDKLKISLLCVKFSISQVAKKDSINKDSRYISWDFLKETIVNCFDMESALDVLNEIEVQVQFENHTKVLGGLVSLLNTASDVEEIRAKLKKYL